MNSKEATRVDCVLLRKCKRRKNEIKIKRTPEMHKDADYGDDAIYWKFCRQFGGT